MRRAPAFAGQSPLLEPTTDRGDRRQLMTPKTQLERPVQFAGSPMRMPRTPAPDPRQPTLARTTPNLQGRVRLVPQSPAPTGLKTPHPFISCFSTDAPLLTKL